MGSAPGPPLDFSFRGLRAVEDLRRRGPRRTGGPQRYRRSPAGLYSSRTLRLNNNQLATVQGLPAVLYQVLDRPELLTWLDLSFNQLSVVSSELSTLDNLKILYLHGNQLADLQGTLAPLAPLLHLFNLTLHGNPVAVRRGYRRRVLSTLPQLRSLDFTNVIASETH